MNLKSIFFLPASASLCLAFTSAVLPTLLFAVDPEDPFADSPSEAGTDEAVDQKGTVFLERGQITKLTQTVNPSVVTVMQRGRGNAELGTGAGFVVSKEGLIATNLHVIGRGRDITIEFQNGESRAVTEIHAWDRIHDLAIVRIDPKGLDLKPLKLSNSDAVTQGQIIVGFGAPRGLKFSVVSGVVSAIRELEEGFLDDPEGTPKFPMLQIAMPIEQGNSGGPVVNLDGEVVGLVTLKHTQTENLGFAVLVNDLKPLLAKPNPTPMAGWKTIGVLSPREWTPTMGANWTQNGGIISVEGTGSGFGGRSLCLSEQPAPTKEFELAVEVKLGDEAGAAGLVFSASDNDLHYGFYPTRGQMRLTRFEGPTVNDWSILTTFPTTAYRPGEWNRLRIAFNGKKIIGFVNGEQVMEIEDDAALGLKGKVGLCQFRGTPAEFKQFAVGSGLETKPIDDALLAKIGKAIDQFAASQDAKTPTLLSELSADSATSSELLEKKAAALEARAAEIRALKSSLHVDQIGKNIIALLDADEIDLFAAGIQIAWVDNPKLDVDYFNRQLDYLADDARKSIGKGAKTDREKVDGLRAFLFEKSGFHGTRGFGQYYAHKNSYLDHVIEYREGLPITLSVVFIELARRLEIKGVHGVPLPGQFMVGHFSESEDQKFQLIDVFEGGQVMTRATAERAVFAANRVPTTDRNFEPAKPRDIIIRMLQNLINIEIEVNKNPVGATQYLDLIIAIDPQSADARLKRSFLRIQERDRAGAESDLDWLLENRPPGPDYDRLQQFRNQLDALMNENSGR